MPPFKLVFYLCFISVDNMKIKTFTTALEISAAATSGPFINHYSSLSNVAEFSETIMTGLACILLLCQPLSIVGAIGS